MKTLALLALLAAPAAANPCRADRVLEGRPLRLTLAPTDGGSPIDLLLRFKDCRVVETDIFTGDETPPSAARFFEIPGIAWKAFLYTPQGSDKTELILLYMPADEAKYMTPLTMLAPKPTASIVSGQVEWGTVRLKNFYEPRFDFTARITTR